ncbi:sugar O-acyltransferase, sialic acid O-acetyltransferase NeuD family [Chryseobacterium arachidis]|uniref:Sugar O-acyltransferase, sialic acid O-acetyltransferase NeuD family n=1 Tax=Chryseobacterium arachidis TaxID=1416778 RepID=A0A1M4XG29_9FLAO|nr:acetyltransferase [Chryseobacterium arachidis]SHE92303.1 sugar O-acyltransferase, sialic acid O-acetyltransferase NeuD family [Chryseobacterium arachidis]
MKTLAIIGSGELGMQIANFAVQDNHYQKVVFFDDFEHNTEKNGYQVLGATDKINQAFEEKKFDELMIGIGYNHLEKRKEIYLQFKNDIPFGNMIHSTTIKDITSKIMPGTVIYPGTILDKNVVISENCLLNLGCVIAHDSTIGDHSFLAPAVKIAGFVTVGEKCFLGINSTIIDNKKITNDVKLGGGSTVTKDIDEPGTYVGSPARKIK